MLICMLVAFSFMFIKTFSRPFCFPTSCFSRSFQSDWLSDRKKIINLMLEPVVLEHRERFIHEHVFMALRSETNNHRRVCFGVIDRRSLDKPALPQSSFRDNQPLKICYDKIPREKLFR